MWHSCLNAVLVSLIQAYCIILLRGSELEIFFIGGVGGNPHSPIIKIQKNP